MTISKLKTLFFLSVIIGAIIVPIMIQEFKTIDTFDSEVLIYPEVENDSILVNESDLKAPDETILAENPDPPEVKENIVDPSVWYQDPIVRVDIDFREHFIRERSIDLYDKDDSLEKQMGSYWDWYIYYEDDDDDFGGLIYDFIVGANSPGTLYFNYTTIAYTETPTPDSVTTTTLFNVSGLTLDADEVIRGRIWIYFSSGGSIYHRTYWFNPITNLYTLLDVTTGTLPGNDDVFQADFWIYDLYYQQDTLVNHIKPIFRYVNSDTREYILYVENFEYSTNITIYAPLAWNITSISPIVAYVEENYNYILLNNTVPVTYKIHFSAGVGYGRDYTRQPQYVAIDEVSWSYLSNYGFENGFSSDWRDLVGSPFESKALNQTIVFEGSSSLRLYDSDGSTDSINTLLPEGYYYFSFSYYIESGSSELEFIVWSGGTWDRTVLDTTNNQRWHQFYKYVHIDGTATTGSPERNVALPYDGAGTIFFDNFRIYQANPQARTIGFSQTEVSAQLVSWDGYLDPVVPYTNVSLALWNNDTSTEIAEYSTITDATGYAEWIYQDTISPITYEIRIWSWESWFGFKCYEYFENLARVSALGTPISYSEEITDDTLKFDIYDTNWFAIRFTASSTFDFSDIDYVSYDLKANVSSNSNTDIYSHIIFCPDSVNYYTYTPDIAYSTSFNDISLSMAEFSTPTGSPDITTWKEFVIYFNQAGGALHITLYLNHLRFIQSQKSYFTPTNLTTGITYNLYESTTHFLLAARNTSTSEVIEDIIFRTWSNQTFTYDWFAFEWIPKNLTTGWHEFSYCAFMRSEDLVYLPTAVYTYDYQIAESGIMKIIIHDQKSNTLIFDSFKVYADSNRLYDNYLYFTDTSETFNLTITDLFDNILYQDLTEDFENFKQIQLNLYSVKILNVQPNPAYLTIIRSGLTYSEWVLSNEIVKYWLPNAEYNFTFYYCNDIGGSFGAAVTNTSYTSFLYTVSADTALALTGQTIQDVWSNVLALQNDLDLTNTSLHVAMQNTVNNITLQFSATNQNVTLLLADTSLVIDTLNSNFTALLADTSILINNLNSLETYLQTNFTQVFTELFYITGNISLTIDLLQALDVAFDGNVSLILSVLNSNFTEVYADFLYLEGEINSNFTQIFANQVYLLGNVSLTIDLLQALDVAFNGNVSLILSILNSNFTEVFADFLYLEGEINSNFTQIFANQVYLIGNISLSIDLLNALDVAFDGNVTLILNILNSNFTEVFADFIYLEGQMNNNFTHIFTNMLEIIGNVTLTIDLLQAMDVNLLGNFTVLINQIDAQTISILNSIISNTTFLTDQLNANFTALQNTIIANNTVLYAQTATILTLLAELKGIYRVHFTFIDSLGIGLDWETALCFVNNSRQFDPDLWVSNNTRLNVSAYDYFSTLIFNSTNFTITSNLQVNITVELWEVIFRNEFAVPIYLTVERNGHIGVKNRVIEVNSSLSLRMLAGEYKYWVYTYAQGSDVQLPLQTSYSSKVLQISTSFTVSKDLPQVVSLKPSTTATPTANVVQSLLTSVIIGSIVGAILGSLAGELFRNYLLYPMAGRHIKSPFYTPQSKRKEDYIDKLFEKFD